MTMNSLPIFQLKRLLTYGGSCASSAHSALRDASGGSPQPHLVPHLSQPRSENFLCLEAFLKSLSKQQRITSANNI